MTSLPGSGQREVLVTGAAGFVGTHLARSCRAAGWTVTGLDVREPRVVGGWDDWVTSAAGDPGVLHDVSSGRYEFVLHQGAVTDTQEMDESLLQDVNVGQALALADACAAGGATFVYASSHSVYGKAHHRVPLGEENAWNHDVCTGPVNLYARSKLDLDSAMLARPAPSRWTALRYTNVFGSGERHKGPMASIISQMLRRAARGEELSLFDDTLDASRDYIPVESVCAVILTLMDRPVPSGVYNLGSAIPVSFETVVRWSAELAGTRPRLRLIPNPIPGRYQYWTCADMTKLESALPQCPKLTSAQIRAAAERLFQSFSVDQGRSDEEP